MAIVPLISDTDPQPHSFAASFDFSKSQILKASKKPIIKIAVYKGRGTPSCAFSFPKLLGKISVPLDLTLAESQPCMFHNSWVSLSIGLVVAFNGPCGTGPALRLSILWRTDVGFPSQRRCQATRFQADEAIVMISPPNTIEGLPQDGFHTPPKDPPSPPSTTREEPSPSVARIVAPASTPSTSMPGPWGSLISTVVLMDLSSLIWVGILMDIDFNFSLW